jgi:hypothetical protein
MTTYTAELTRIAGDVDALGVTANETAIALVVAWARSAGVDPVLLSVLSDPTEPEVARARAFGRVATDLTASADQHPRHLQLVAAAS